jgi:predicted AlkP superfamily pyrophosphatase or phosphodiesterase
MNPNVILLIIDSFRSDKFFDIDTSKKPNIDNLIKNGIFFSPGVSFISYSHTSEILN